MQLTIDGKPVDGFYKVSRALIRAADHCAGLKYGVLLTAARLERVLNYKNGSIRRQLTKNREPVAKYCCRISPRELMFGNAKTIRDLKRGKFSKVFKGSPPVSR